MEKTESVNWRQINRIYSIWAIEYRLKKKFTKPWDSWYHQNPRLREQEYGAEKIFREIMAKNFSNLDKDIKEIEKTPIKINPKKVKPR